ncbi:DUF397 domain-containing protein [Streptomyces sp. NPDC013181]|uniref:DUF397 domain-containing protein n=1 Tax=Streptomyces sp. NPDC013181 TaxID=3364864 RepID=UPI003692FBA4
MKQTSTDYGLATSTWRKSTYSDGSGGNCLEVLDGIPHAVPVRDSKVTDGPAVVFGAAAWQTFVADVKTA